jgi:hypothetical protein
VSPDHLLTPSPISPVLSEVEGRSAARRKKIPKAKKRRKRNPKPKKPDSCVL